MKVCLIVNPHAGKKTGVAAAARTVEFLKARKIECRQLLSMYPGESVTLASSLDHSAWDGIIAVGGDGTLFEVLNGLHTNHERISVPVGQIPVGTGNSFLKDLNIQTEEDAWEAIVSRKTRKVDLARFSYEKGSHYFINLLGAGFVSNVAHTANHFKRWGSLSYIIAVLKEMLVLKSSSIELIIDGKRHTQQGIFVEICNSRYTGGDMLMAPGARIDDGLLEIVFCEKISRRKLLQLFPLIFKGTHVDDPALKVFSGKKVSLSSESPLLLTPDGETFGSTPLEAEIIPNALDMFSR